MKLFPCLYACVLSISLLAVPSSFAKAKPDVLVVADVVNKDPAIPARPEPGKPIYYYILGKMERDIGSPYAGAKSPDPEKVRAYLVKAMNSQGYVESKVGGHQPNIILVLTWGQANPTNDTITDTVDSADAEALNTTSQNVTNTVSLNADQMSQLVGANKVDNRKLSTNESDLINDAMTNERLYLFVAAFDAEALVKKEKKIVWRTRFSIDAKREDLTENLELMFASAAPYFGRDESKPIIVDDDTRRSTVKLGELKFEDDNSTSKEPAKK